MIPLMSYNVFTMMDTTYWTGYPSAETDPYTDPVPNWANTKYMMVKLKPASATIVAVTHLKQAAPPSPGAARLSSRG